MSSTIGNQVDETIKLVGERSNDERHSRYIEVPYKKALQDRTRASVDAKLTGLIARDVPLNVIVSAVFNGTNELAAWEQMRRQFAAIQAAKFATKLREILTYLNEVAIDGKVTRYYGGQDYDSPTYGLNEGEIHVPIKDISLQDFLTKIYAFSHPNELQNLDISGLLSLLYINDADAFLRRPITDIGQEFEAAGY